MVLIQVLDSKTIFAKQVLYRRKTNDTLNILFVLFKIIEYDSDKTSNEITMEICALSFCMLRPQKAMLTILFCG